MYAVICELFSRNEGRNMVRWNIQQMMCVSLSHNSTHWWAHKLHSHLQKCYLIYNKLMYDIYYMFKNYCYHISNNYLHHLKYICSTYLWIFLLHFIFHIKHHFIIQLKDYNIIISFRLVWSCPIIIYNTENGL